MSFSTGSEERAKFAGRTALLWIKFALAAIIVLFCTFLGFFASQKYRDRRSFFSDLYSFNQKYLAELKFSRKPLSELLGDTEPKGDFFLALKEFLGARKVNLCKSYLTKEEKDFVLEYLQMLGRGDSHSQSGYFSAQDAALFKWKEESMKNAKNYTDLYLKLGLLGGLAVVILIV